MAMNPNVGMANMNAMGGPVGGAPVPMMQNGMNPQAAAASAAAAAGAANANANRLPQQQPGDQQRTHLNTYIYEYFLRYDMHDCARSMISNKVPINLDRESKMNGAGDDSMDTDTKDDFDQKLPEDLPPPKLPNTASDTSFLYEWFCLFWEIYNAQRQKGGNGAVNQYVAHTQQASRLRQNQQQEMLRQMRPDMTQQQYQAQMIRNMQNMNGMAAMNMKNNNLARAAMANNQNNPQMAMLAQQQQQQAKANQMQRDPSQMNANGADRPSSPAGGENAPSPSKRPRMDSTGGQIPQQQAGAVMGAGRGQMMPGQVAGMQPGLGPQSSQAAHQNAHNILQMNGINPNSLAPGQLAAFINSGPQAQAKSIQSYSQHLQHQQTAQAQMGKGPNGAGPPGQGLPGMMQPGPDGQTLSTYYNPDINAANGVRAVGPGTTQAAGSNHALQDYQMQLMLLEQQNKKRLMMARQEQDNIGNNGGPGPSPGGPGQQMPNGPNGQSFQDTSPSGMRSGASPNPSEQMKRGTPQMGNPGIPSPGGEGGQSRGSPNTAMNFMGQHGGDPKMNPQFAFGVDGNPAAQAAHMNGMRPPPGQAFQGPMNPQQMMARQQQAAAQGQGPNGQQWQQGPNGQMVPAGMPQPGQPQPGQPGQGTPQQRAMPPPSAPATAAANAANRATASPQQGAAAPPTPNQGNKAAPKKKETKAAKEKRAAANKKSNQNLNQAANSTPAAEGDGDGAAPATPITPVNPGFKGAQNGAQGAGTAVPNASAPAPAPPHGGNDPSQQPVMDGFGGMVDIGNLDFSHTGNDVLNDFDFDSFLHDGDGGDQPFSFGDNFVGDGGEIPAE